MDITITTLKLEMNVTGIYEGQYKSEGEMGIWDPNSNLSIGHATMIKTILYFESMLLEHGKKKLTGTCVIQFPSVIA